MGGGPEEMKEKQQKKSQSGLLDTVSVGTVKPLQSKVLNSPEVIFIFLRFILPQFPQNWYIPLQKGMPVRTRLYPIV